MTSDTLREFDRRTVEFPRLAGWIGYAEEHGIVLDFGDRLRDLSPGTPLVLALAGWVEYPYSQTNYAAASAGITLQPPVLERQQDDGSWKVLEASPGYPAGLPRMTTLDLTGKLGGPRCVLRLRTNMECYYDQAFLAVREPDAGVRATSLAVSRAVLGYRGYLREVSPDGRQPLLYDHDYADPAPSARLDGHLTRYGDVAPLLRDDDDRQCLIGPGDEARIEFDAAIAAALARRLDPLLRPPLRRLLQGRRPRHRRQRHRRPAAVEGDARLPVRPRGRPAARPGIRRLSARLDDEAERCTLRGESRGITTEARRELGRESD